ncbi:MAG: putative peptide zinc metalloprotease protein [bacterium]
MTHAIRRRALLLGALAAGALGAFLPSPAAAQDSAAVAVNTRDESSIFRLAFNIRRVTGDVVDQTNAAVAYASCNECRTVAISFQVLLVQSDASIVSPENLALTINEDCTLCDTFAAAYQIVLGDGTRLRFTAEGSQAIAQIRRDLQALRDQNLSDDDLDAQLDAIYGRLKGVLDTQLVGVGEPGPQPSSAQAAEQTTTEPPAETAPTTTTTPATPPAETTPAETTPSPTQTTPTDTVPAQTTTAPAGTQTTP